MFINKKYLSSLVGTPNCQTRWIKCLQIGKKFYKKLHAYKLCLSFLATHNQKDKPNNIISITYHKPYKYKVYLF